MRGNLRGRAFLVEYEKDYCAVLKKNRPIWNVIFEDVHNFSGKIYEGADLEPVRAKKAWAELGVDANGVANDVPDENFIGMPRLTKEMLALIQGFPPVAEKVGLEIRSCLKNGKIFNP